MNARGGSVAWNAVSKTATCGRSGNARRATSIPTALTGLCSGASTDRSRIAASTASSISTGAEKRSPPCTTRCATATRPSSGADASTASSAAAWSGTTAGRSCTVPESTVEPASTSTTDHFSDDDPQLTTRTRHCAWMAVIATVLTMSCTVAPRERSLTGLFSPCSTGPMAIAPALRWTAL